MRERAVLAFCIFEKQKNSHSVRTERLLKSMFSPNQISLPRNRMLRPRILEALGNLGHLNALQLTGMVYGPRRARLRSSTACTNSQLVATRRALRRLRAKGVVVAAGRYRRQKLYALKRHADALASISLGRFP
jgi:hypothetical protein